MASENFVPGQNNIPSADDPFDINDLASLDGDYSIEFIEQLQNQLTQNALGGEAPKNDAELFEEVAPINEEFSKVATEVSEQNNESNSTEITGDEVDAKTTEVPPEKDIKSVKLGLEDNFDDNFIKKYKAKLNKQQNMQVSSNDGTKKKSKFAAFETKDDIESLTGGNIVEKPVVKEHVAYNDSLDLLDENVKYSKYVVYIDPENTEFIESLTVKERKNLINKILREQDDVMLTKRRFNTVQAVIKHTIVAIITVAIAIPIIYATINASLEASIDNYRRSKSMFNTLYKEKGKIKSHSVQH